MHHHKGMTLIECLVAIAIAAVLGMLLMSMMTHVLRSKQHHVQRQTHEFPMHDLALQLGQDMAAMIPRSVQWASGEWSPVIHVSDHQWCWTSMRNINPNASLQESSWYRLCYAQQGSQLLRYAWVPGDGQRHAAARVTNRWRGIESVRVSWPAKELEKHDAFFWPMLWSWDFVTDGGPWQNVYRVRVWPKPLTSAS